MRPATASRLGDTLTLAFEPCASGANRIDQAELIRLFDVEHLSVAGALITARIRDPSAKFAADANCSLTGWIAGSLDRWIAGSLDRCIACVMLDHRVALLRNTGIYAQTTAPIWSNNAPNLLINYAVHRARF